MSRRTNRLWGAGLLLGGLLLAGCGNPGDGTEAGSGAGGDVPVTGVRWVPQSVTVDGERYALPPGAEAYVTIDPGKKGGAGGKSGGSTGCNHLGADVTVHGDTLEVSDVATTSMGCSAARERFERKFLEVFTGELTAEVSNGRDTLTLTAGDGDRITLEATAERGTAQPS